ncbi:hypothetical protein HYT58_02520 [Candidatus Woesearchaeota archaeon]|nr:hypothetical protein [Candidatus Woesearchaeota archaeon]
MKTHNHIYDQIISLDNLYLAYKKARKNKTTRGYVIEFEQDIANNLVNLHEELKNQTYLPKPLETFTLRDPKTRKISKSEFRDRVVHHALCNIMAPIYDKIFIYDSCANIKGKGNIFAVKRFDKFKRKVSKKPSIRGYCLKADVKHYFDEVNHDTLINIIKRKITDEKVIGLIKKIIKNSLNRDKGMPLGNMTSQFFANVYLNELDYFVKHILRANYYIRYVDDFVILHNSREQLEAWKEEINKFLLEKLRLKLHPEKTRIIPISRGIDFVGFRNFYHSKLLRRRNVRKMICKIALFKNNEISYEKLMESFQGWQAYAKWANTHKLRKEIAKEIHNLKRTHLVITTHSSSM